MLKGSSYGISRFRECIKYNVCRATFLPTGIIVGFLMIGVSMFIERMREVFEATDPLPGVLLVLSVQRIPVSE